MKKLMVLALILLSIHDVSAATKKVVKKKAASNVPADSKLGTSFKFDGSSLRGKSKGYPNSTATVENDKFLDDLLGGRKQFDDRLDQEQKRN